MAEQTTFPASILQEPGTGAIAPAGRALSGKGDKALFSAMLAQGLEKSVLPTESNKHPEGIVKTEDLLQAGSEVDRINQKARPSKSSLFGHSGSDPGRRSWVRRNDDEGSDMIKFKGLEATPVGGIADFPAMVPDGEAGPAGQGLLQSAVSMQEASSPGGGIAVSQVMVSNKKADSAVPSLGQPAAWDQEASSGGRGIIALPTTVFDGKAVPTESDRFQPSVSVQKSSSVDAGISASPPISSDSEVKTVDLGRFQFAAPSQESSSGGGIAVSPPAVSDEGAAKPADEVPPLTARSTQEGKVPGLVVKISPEKAASLPSGVWQAKSLVPARITIDKTLQEPGSDMEQSEERSVKYGQSGTERAGKDAAVTLPATMKGDEREGESGRIGQRFEFGKANGALMEQAGASVTSSPGREPGPAHHGLPEQPQTKAVDYGVEDLNKDAKPLREGVVGSGPFRGEGLNIPGVVREGLGQPVTVEKGSIIEQIASQLPKEATGSGRVHITLNPPHLGSLDMDIFIRDNKVRVVMAVEHHDVRNILQQHAGELRNALLDQGVQVGVIDILLQNGMQGRQDGLMGGGFRWYEERRSREGGKEQEVKANLTKAGPAASGIKREALSQGISVFI